MTFPDPNTILEQLSEGVIITDAAGHITFVNQAARDIHGAAELGVPVEGYSAAYHLLTLEGAPYPPEELPLARAVLRGETVTDALWRIRRPDGTEIVAQGSARPLRNADGVQEGSILTVRDITALRDSETRFRTIVEQSPFSTQVLSPSGRTVMVNHAWEELWGLTLEQMHDYNMLEDVQLVEKGIMPFLLRGFAGEPTPLPPIPYDVDETLPGRTVHRDPVHWVEAFIYPVKDQAGAIIQVILVHWDVTTRIRAQEALERNAGEIMELNERLRRAMLETHHRVRNNLQIIAALVDMQAGEEATVPMTEFKRIGSQVKALATVHDLLTQQAKEGGEASALSARELLEKLIDSIRSSVSTLPHGTEAARLIRTELDDTSLSARQGTSLSIVTNELVTNAIKHSPGDVEVCLRVGHGQATLEVSDTGPGFPPMFDPSDSDSHGLALVQNVVRWDLSGKIAFGIRPEGGGRVTLTFPTSVVE